MPLKNTSYGYGSIAKFLHWLVAFMIIGLLVLGFVMADREPSPDTFRLYNIHKSMGALLLLTVGVRLMWKMCNVAPALPNSIPKIEQTLAHLGHFILYVLIISMPVSGWLMSSSAGFPVSVFGWFTLPDLIQPMPEWKHFFEDAHGIIAWGIIVMVSLHVLAALLHHFYYRNNVLLRMLPFTNEVKSRDTQIVADSDTLTGC